jgi:SAM-dependent methyltransferase
MPRHDDFQVLSRYYDDIMTHVRYARWMGVLTELTAWLPRRFRHLDAACGTGVLLHHCRGAGWRSIGCDLSAGMLRAAQRKRGTLPVVQADLQTLPCPDGAFHLLTCLFDSLNFLLEDHTLHAAMRECARVLAPGGIFYFDFVTERMVTDFYLGPEWMEDNGTFRTAWHTDYDRASGIADTAVRINSGAAQHFRERIYPPRTFRDALANNGLRLLLEVDAETWRAPRPGSTRIDMIAQRAGGTAPPRDRDLEEMQARIRERWTQTP